MSEIFFDAITNIREELVEEAQEFVFRRRHASWRRYAGMAACLVLAVTLFFGVYQLSQVRMGSSGSGADNAAPTAGGGQPGSNSSASQESEAVSGDTSGYGGVDIDGTDPSHSGGEPEDSMISFPAVVLEVRMDALLVEVLSNNDMGVQQIEIPTGGLEDLPEFRAGDVVTVYCAGLFAQDGVAAAFDVAAIMLTEPLSDSP